jgi:DNA repair protein RecN (Recombination protein N)
MLTALAIRNFVLIDEIALAPGPGLTALTGETGAGKSILLEALSLAAGGRAERSALRRNASEASVVAAFEPGAAHPVWKKLEEHAIAADGDQVILRRVQTKDGKSRAFVNDQPTSVSLLNEVGEALVEIHGQHDGRGFLTASTHRGLLDDYAGLADKRARVCERWSAWRRAAAAIEERRAGRATAAAQADYLRHVVETLARLDPKPDEERALAQRRSDLQAAAKSAEDIDAATALIADGVEEKLGAAARRLARSAQARGDDPAAAALARLDAALSETMEARAALDRARETLDGDPGALEGAEERLFALRAEARKHGVQVDALASVLDRARAALADLDSGEAGFAALEAQAKETEGAYFAAARDLSAKRAAAAKKLDAAVTRELAPLKLARAEFSTAIRANPDRPTSEGFDEVEFMVRTNPGSPAGPLKSIASGGELSRFVLAMKAALAAKESRTVIIFDEVDQGVGGAVADAVGERLARLAREAQVLVVTHSPQVAARADAHWRIVKRQGLNETTILVEALSPGARIEEIARMLSGAETTAEARAAARRLLGSGSPSAEKPRKRA